MRNELEMEGVDAKTKDNILRQFERVKRDRNKTVKITPNKDVLLLHRNWVATSTGKENFDFKHNNYKSEKQNKQVTISPIIELISVSENDSNLNTNNIFIMSEKQKIIY